MRSVAHHRQNDRHIAGTATLSLSYTPAIVRIMCAGTTAMHAAAAPAASHDPLACAATRPTHATDTTLHHAGISTQMSFSDTASALRPSTRAAHLPSRHRPTARNCIPGNIVVPTGRPIGYQLR